MTSLILSVVISILSYGAVADDTTVNNAPAINQAITDCAALGGGTVVVPPGNYTTGSLFMKSRVTLHLEKGAILKGSARMSDYASLTTQRNLSRYESGVGTVNYNSATDEQWSKAMIFAIETHHASITGPGAIDGADVRNPLGEEHMRGPHTILAVGCRHLQLDSITINHSANYAILGFEISASTFSHLKINGGWDGIHIRGAKNISISHCVMHTGDDALAGGYWHKAKIEGCVLNSSCNGIRMIMPSSHVEISDCTFEGPGRYPHITSGRTATEHAINIQPGGWGKAPGRLDHIYIRRCRISHVLAPIAITLSEDNKAGTIVIDHLTATDIQHMAMSVKSWGTAMTHNVVISNSDLEFVGKNDPTLPDFFKGKPFSEWPVFPCWAIYLRNIDKVRMNNVRLRLKGHDYREAITYDHVGHRRVNINVYQ